MTHQLTHATHHHESSFKKHRHVLKCIKLVRHWGTTHDVGSHPHMYTRCGNRELSSECLDLL